MLFKEIFVRDMSVAEKPRIFSCDHHQIPLPSATNSRWPNTAATRALQAENLFRIDQPVPADPDTITLAHDRAYVEAFLSGYARTANHSPHRFPWSPGLVARTLCSVGGTLAATSQALDTGFSGALAAGPITPSTRRRWILCFQ